MKKVKDFMSRRVLYLKPDDTIFKAAKSFCRRNISGAPVVSSAQSKRVIGVVSESDIVKFMGTKICNTQSMAGDFTYQSLSLLLLHFVRTGKDYLGFKKELGRISKTKIKDVMSKRVISVSPEESVLDAAQRMDANDVNRLPVVKNGKLVGIIARADLLKALVS
jgi:CBS domain-containing protein